MFFFYAQEWTIEILYTELETPTEPKPDILRICVIYTWQMFP